MTQFLWSYKSENFIYAFFSHENQIFKFSKTIFFFAEQTKQVIATISEEIKIFLKLRIWP